MELDTRNMAAIPIEAFVKGLPLRVDTYLSLNSEKFVMLFKAGMPLDLERIQGYRDRSLRHLHVHKNDCGVFFATQLSMAGQALNHPKLLPEHRVHFMNLAHQVLLARFDHLGFSSDSFEIAKDMAKSVVSFVTTEPKLMHLIQRFEQSATGTLNHSMAVGMLAVQIGRAMGWTRPETLEKLVLGGILHDIGMIEISSVLRTKARSEMNATELAEYESHVERGVRILQTVPNVPSDLIAITQDHHELASGEGYPRQLRDVKINPLAKVVSLADVFTELTSPTENDVVALTPEKALAFIEASKGQPFNKDAFKKLKGLVSEGKL